MQEQKDIQSETTETEKVAITKKMTTGEVTKKYPATKEVFSKHFGKSCFDCPAFGTEDINLACMMHNTDVNKFVSELIEAAQKEIDSKGS
jgi:hybrid cluster-associated redox disulfide protein